MILALKLFLAPLLISTATLAGRRWGPVVSGWFIGFPFISGPVSMILAAQNGYTFASSAAVGMLAGQASMCLFCASYILAARKFPWWLSAPIAIMVFLASAAFWNSIALPLLPSFLILIGLIILLLLYFPDLKIPGSNLKLPWWDLPARMIVAVVFVATVTSLAPKFGPLLSGMLSAFPVFGTILSTFTHAQQGGQAAGQLLRGTILGSFGIAIFFMTVGLVMPLTNSMWTYLFATTATILVNGISLKFTLPKKTVPDVTIAPTR